MEDPQRYSLYDLLDSQDLFTETINTPKKTHWLFENNFCSWPETDFLEKVLF